VRLPPIWILGSSGASAQLAGSLGTGYSFARHFSPTPPAPAFRAYRESFRPSERFPEPHAILAVSVVTAETDEEADYLARSMDLSWVRLQRGEPGPLSTPEEATAYAYSPHEQAVVRAHRALNLVGTPDRVHESIVRLVEESGADEVMVSSMIHGHAQRMRSYELLAWAFDLGARPVGTAA
jgi:luciferase family oxidoreductase group 1